MKITIEQNRVRQTVGEYKSFPSEKSAHVCISDWANGEGFDVEMEEEAGVSMFPMTYDQWYALRKTMKAHRAWDGTEQNKRQDRITKTKE